MFAIIHPSQPNYLELSSGANQGVVDDGLPPNFSTTPTSTYPFRTANLAAELIGFTFAGAPDSSSARSHSQGTCRAGARRSDPCHGREAAVGFSYVGEGSGWVYYPMREP